MEDRIITQDQGFFYTTGKLSENIETTPEGYLLCRNVPIARTGTLFYGPGETPIATGVTGGVEVVRTEEDLFSLETLASLNGKAVTIGHPEKFINPDTWQKYAVGTVMNPRRGEGKDNDLLLADLLITDSAAISLIRSGQQREISGGYHSKYEMLSVGRGRQHGILFNHVALVGRGRCGGRCIVQDEHTEGNMMDEKILEAERRGLEKGFFAGLLQRLQGSPTRDQEHEPEKKEKVNDEDVEALKKEIADLKAELAKHKKPETKDNDGDDDKKKEETKDHKALDAVTVSELVSAANIILPGYTPTTDSLKSDVSLRRDILRKAYDADAQKKSIAPIIENFTGKEPKFETLDAATVSAALLGTVGLIRAKNNSRLTSGLLSAIPTTDSASTEKRFDDEAANLWK